MGGCAQPTPEQQFLNDAAAALGGRTRIQAVKTLTIEGEGTNYNLGQDMKPDAATQQFAITGYKRQIDVANRRQRVEQTRTPKFAYFQGPQPQKQIQGLDGEVAFNVNPPARPRGSATQAELDRRADFYHHPLAAGARGHRFERDGRQRAAGRHGAPGRHHDRRAVRRSP